MATVTRLSGAFVCAFLFLATCARSEAQNEAPPKAATVAEPAASAPSTPVPKKVDEAPTTASVKRLREVWYEFLFNKRKIGFVRATDELTQVNGRPAYHLNRYSMLAVKRQAQTVEISSTTDSWFGLDGTPMRFVTERREGAEARKVEGYRDGQTMVVRMSIGKNLTEKRIPITKDLRLSSSLEVLIAEKLKVGASMTGKVVDETQGDVLPYSTKVESVDASGRFAVRQSVGPIEADVTMTPDGEVVSVTLPDMRVSQVRTSRAQAVKAVEAVDLFSAALFRMPRPLPERHSMEQLILRLSSARGETIKAITDDRQKAKQIGKASELTIRVQEPPKKSPARPLISDNTKKFLGATDYEPLNDESLRATTERLTAGKKSVWDAARAINAFVYRHIENKSLARAYASAPEALASKEGDCTEHAVLFSALAKIAGVPTRLVTGLVYVGGAGNVFGYHEWVEIWTGKQWLAMDPTFGQDIADATHIKLYAGLSDAQGLRVAGKVAASAIGDLEIKLVGYVDASGRRHAL